MVIQRLSVVSRRQPHAADAVGGAESPHCGRGGERFHAQGRIRGRSIPISGDCEPENGTLHKNNFFCLSFKIFRPLFARIPTDCRCRADPSDPRSAKRQMRTAAASRRAHLRCRAQRGYFRLSAGISSYCRRRMAGILPSSAFCGAERLSINVLLPPAGACRPYLPVRRFVRVRLPKANWGCGLRVAARRRILGIPCRDRRCG